MEEKEVTNEKNITTDTTDNEMWGRKWVADYEPDYCIAADSGLVMADKLGLTVDLLLGDYDSVDKKIFEKYNGNTKTITYPCEKDYTDTHLALKKAIFS